MKGHQFDLDFGVIEINGEDMMDDNERTEEAKKKMKEIDTAKEKAEIAQEELVEAAKQSKMLLEEIALQKQKLNEIPDTVPEGSLEINISDTVESERDTKALDILEKERQMQLERELEWKKEKRVKKIKRWIKTSLIVIPVVVIGLAWLAGYRIPIPEEIAIHAQGIWESAKDFVVSYFTNN